MEYVCRKYGERYQGVYDEKIQGFYVEPCNCEEEE